MLGLGSIVTTPWWVLVALVQINVVVIIVAILFYSKFKHASSALVDEQARMRQQIDQATTHKLKIAEMELQLESLDAFQEMYFELQSQHEKLQAAHEEFTAKASELLSDEDQAKLQTILYELRVEKDKLEQKLQKVGSSLQHILDKQQRLREGETDSSAKAVYAAVDEVDNEIQAIGDVIEQQQQLIDQLNQQLASMQLEIAAKQQLEAMIAPLQQQNAQLGEVVAGLNQQNQRLKLDLKTMEAEGRAVGSDFADELQRLQQALEDKEQAYDALYKKYVAIEAEYQNIYAKTNKVRM